MTQIEGLGGKVNWDSLLNALQGTDGTQDVSKPKLDANLQLGDALAPPIDAPAPAAPKLEAPATAPGGNAANLQNLLDKLGGDNTFKPSVKELGTTKDTMQNLLGSVANKLEQNRNAEATGPAPANAPSAKPATNTAKMLFDLYALMSLLVECAQEQKNAQRTQRQAETAAVVNSIQSQADAQRSAALTGLIAGSLVCAIQATVACVAAYKTISNIKADSALATETGIKQAATEVSQAQSQLKTDMDALSDFDTAHPVPEGGNLPEDVQHQRAELQQKVDDAKATLMQKNQAMKLKQAVMAQSDDFIKIKISEARWKAVSDVNMSLGNLGQNLVKGFVDLQQADAVAKGADQKKAEEELAQTKDMMDSFQDVMDQVLKLAQAILQAENESMRSAIQA